MVRTRTARSSRLERVAAGKSDEELVIAGAPDEVVAAQVAAQAICEFLRDPKRVAMVSRTRRSASREDSKFCRWLDPLAESSM